MFVYTQTKARDPRLRRNIRSVSAMSASNESFPAFNFGREYFGDRVVDAEAVPESFASYTDAMDYINNHDFTDRTAITRFITSTFTMEDIIVFSRFGWLLREIFGEL